MTTNTKIPLGFGSDEIFEVEPKYPDRKTVADKFAELKSALIEDIGAGIEASLHQTSLEFAANEAASLAWTTPYPLLVFPALLVEIADKVQERAARQKTIRGRSQMILAETV